ncbi:MAG: histidine phosphatase family protein [Planctomycetota bacterium]
MTLEQARIHLCRHGEVAPEWRERVYGKLDVELADEGRLRFELLADALRELPLAGVYASDLCRARSGAELIAAAHGLEVRLDPRLREIDRGSWAGRSIQAVEELSPGGFQRYKEAPMSFREHGGESHGDLLERVRPALIELADRHRGEEILAVTHGQVMRVLLAWVLGISGPASMRVMTSYGGLTTIDRFPDGDWVVQAVNAPSIRPGEWGGRTTRP